MSGRLCNGLSFTENIQYFPNRNAVAKHICLSAAD